MVDKDETRLLLDVGMKLTTNVALSGVVDAFDGEDRDKAVSKLRESLSELIRVEQEYNVGCRASKEVKEKLDNALDNENYDMKIDVEYNKMLRNLKKEVEYDVKEHKWMKNFEAKLEKLSNVSGDENTVGSRKDPFTKAPIKDPVENERCGHIYERSTVMEIIEKNPNERCPYIGCPNKQPITEEVLK